MILEYWLDDSANVTESIVTYQLYYLSQSILLYAELRQSCKRTENSEKSKKLVKWF